MTAASNVEPPRRGFALPSAYTILFILIVAVAAADLDHPGRRVRARCGRRADPRHLPHGRAEPAADRRRLADGADQRPLRHREAEDGSVSVWNSGELFGAIDVALFILVIGGFLGVTMKTGAIQAGIGTHRRPAGRPGAPDDPDPDDRVRDRRHDVRDGRGEPRVLRPDHHGDDRGRLRRARRRGDPPARLRDRRARLDDQPVRDRHRLGVRRRLHRARASSGGSSSSSSGRSSASSSSCAMPRASRRTRRSRSSSTRSEPRTRRASRPPATRRDDVPTA